MVILHDLSVVHLVFNSLLAIQDDYFVATMQRWYGDDGRRAALEGLQHRGEWAWRPETVQQFPLTEVALEGATSVVTHSEYAADSLTGRYVGEVTVIPLPVDLRPVADTEVVDLALPEDRLVVLQAGVLNPNKHVPVVLEAIQEAGLADDVHLVICGHAQPKELLAVRRLIDSLGLSKTVTVLGEVSDATLHALRTRADIATVLRHPCGEAASAVLAETLGYGIPVVTVDDGCYREAPDEAVVRVQVPPVPEDVGAALRRWVDDPHLRARAAEFGRAFVAEHHSPQAYATDILAALRRTGSARRRAALAADLSAIAARAGFGPESSLVDRLAERAHELFGPRPAQLASTIPPGEQTD
jgi:glycosyltransferase involved in cell wall biosynthesis